MRERGKASFSGNILSLRALMAVHAAWQPAVTENDGRSNFAGFLLRHQRIGTR